MDPADRPVPRCAHCGTPLPAPAPTGRPARWCSPACRTRAGRAAGHDLGVEAHPAPTPVSHDGEYRYVTPACRGVCPLHPGCVVVGCARFGCSQPVHVGDQRGQPRRFCSPACRVAEHRRLTQ